MGLEVKNVDFGKVEREEFESRLKSETQLLINSILTENINNEDIMCGYEIEGCILDRNFCPSLSSEKLLGELSDDSIVPEISQHNFEINGSPKKYKSSTFSEIESDIQATWNTCVKAAEKNNLKVTTIGSLPTLKEDLMSLDSIAPRKRYYSLNREVLNFRQGRAINLDIEGHEKYHQSFPDVMSESAATSLQIHMGVTAANAKHVYNASIIASSLISATCANSPYLFGKDLWSETRVPIFEQAVDFNSYTSDMGEAIKRVGLGAGYVQNCISELFVENAYKHPILLPELFDNCATEFKHMNFQNGTVWRWNRPIVSKGEDGRVQLRLEQRVPSSGPSNKDMTANMAFIIGLINYLATKEDKLMTMPFFIAKHNFYQSCKYGLNAKLLWYNGQEATVRDLVNDDLINQVKHTLINMGMDKDEINYYIDEVFHQRIKMNLTGSSWQRNYIERYGKDFSNMMSAYLENQKEGHPLWKWKI